MKLFTKSDNAKLFANYSKGSDMATQNVVVKIFNPYGNGRWYIMNSDPNDPDYMWGIVDLGQGAEIGSISRSDLENYRNRFGWKFERDMSFRPKNSSLVLKGLNEGNFFAGGGEVEFIEYGDSQIMYEPHYKKYYANEMEFDTLQEAKKFIDSGEVPEHIRNAYAKGLFKKGGRLLSTKERYIAELKGLTGLQQKAIEDYIDENNLTSDEVLHIVIGLGRKQISGSDVSTAIVGKKNNSESKKLLDFAMSKESLKAEYGAFMDGVYADGGYFDGTIPKVSNYMTTYVKGGMVVTSIKDIPNFKKNLDEGKITYRGLGMGKVFNDFYDIAGESGTRIKVDGKEYFITDTEFDSFSRGADGKMRIKFDAPQRKGYENGGFMDGVYAGGGGLKKYILRSDIKEVWVKLDNGIQFTFKGSDVLNGANFLEKGNLLKNDAIYVPKRNIMYVILKNGNKVKPSNGYWIKKDAKGDLFKPEKNDEYKVESNVGIFYKVGTKTYWYVVNSKNQTINKNTGKPYKGKEMTNYYFLNEDGAKDFAEKLNKGLFVERKFEDGGKTTFAEKSSAIAKNFVGKAVEPKYQKEYGKRYDAKEAKEVGNKIAGKQKASYDQKNMKSGGSVKSDKLKKVTQKAKEIRKEGEKWQSAMKRAYAMMK